MLTPAQLLLWPSAPAPHLLPHLRNRSPLESGPRDWKVSRPYLFLPAASGSAGPSLRFRRAVRPWPAPCRTPQSRSVRHVAPRRSVGVLGVILVVFAGRFAAFFD